MNFDIDQYIPVSCDVHAEFAPCSRNDEKRGNTITDLFFGVDVQIYT